MHTLAQFAFFLDPNFGFISNSMIEKCYLILIALVLAPLAVGCSSGQASPSPAGNPSPTLQSVPYPPPQGLPPVNATPIQSPLPLADAPQPSPGKASISGTLYSVSTSRVIPETPFYLTRGIGSDERLLPIVLEGPNPEKGDLSGKTDAMGQFQLNGIPPGNYYLFVWAPYTWVPADNSATDLTPRLLELSANQKEPLGIVYVSWP